MKKKLQEIAANFLQNILYKTLFTINFVRNTYEFNNFVGNNYPQKNYLPIKILKKNSRKKSVFLQFFLTNLKKKIHIILKILVVPPTKIFYEI